MKAPLYLWVIMSRKESHSPPVSFRLISLLHPIGDFLGAAISRTVFYEAGPCKPSLCQYLSYVPTVIFDYRLDGMVLLDEEYVRGRKVFGQVVCTFRYGREEDEVMGLNFYKELFLASEQIYPPPEKRNYELSKTQVEDIFHSHHQTFHAH